MFSEIRNDYIYGPAVESGTSPNDDDMLATVAIDGWKTDDDNSPGETIASVILTKHGDIVVDWHDNGARMVRSVLEAIQEAKKTLQDIWSEKAAITDSDLSALSKELQTIFNQTDKTAKLYYLKDDQGDLGLIRVNNWNDNFDQTMQNAFDKWQSSQNEFHEEFYGYLQTCGYDVDILDCDTIRLS